MCVDILAPSEAMTPVLYNPACGFASGGEEVEEWGGLRTQPPLNRAA